jgi:protein TonB
LVKTQLLCLGLLLTGPFASRAQAPRAAVPSPVSSFFTPDFRPISAPDSTSLCAETTFRDSLSGFTRVYYPSGRLKQYIPYGNLPRNVRHGCFSTWYENGQMCTKEDYVNGVRHGDLLTYYPDGTLKRREKYVSGRAGIGTCYNPDGTPIPYFVYEQLPLYPGGDGELLKELSKGVRLNRQELEAMRRESARMARSVELWGKLPPTLGWKRQVNVELAVAEDGRVVNARVAQSGSPFLNSAALRAVATLKRQFVPARRDGQVVTCRLTVPVYYTMEAYNRRPTPTRNTGGTVPRWYQE